MKSKLTLGKSKESSAEPGDIMVYKYVNPIDTSHFLTVFLLVTQPEKSNGYFGGCCIHVESVGTSHGWYVGSTAELPIKDCSQVYQSVTVEFIND